MSTQLRLIVGGLSRDTTTTDLAALVAPFGESRFALMEVPGDNDQAVAVVQLGANAAQADRLRQRLNHRRHHGRTLWTWLTFMPWA